MFSNVIEICICIKIYAYNVLTMTYKNGLNNIMSIYNILYNIVTFDM